MRPISIMMLLLLITSGGLLGQTKTHTVKPKGSLTETRLIISGLLSDIVIEGTSRSDIEISTDHIEEKPERADGLRSLSDMAAENTPIGLNVEYKGNEIYVVPASRRAQDADYVFKIPNSIKVKVSGDSFNSNHIKVSGMTNEVELTSQSGDILVDKVTGPIVAKTISGDIDIIISTLNQKLPSSINSISGDIDITLSSSDKGSFSISSISGEVFTDLDLKVSKTGKSVNDVNVDVNVNINEAMEKAMKETERAMKETEKEMKEMQKEIDEEVRKEVKNVVVVVPDVPSPPQIPFHYNWATPSGIGSAFKAELNGGGVDFNISSISGDVYLRKNK
ncbi:MAG: DUF4097 family beta strand repeat-containing protein [Bacteroidota bacterium]